MKFSSRMNMGVLMACWLACLGVMGGVGNCAFADDAVKVYAQLDSEKIYLGDEVLYQIVIEGVKGAAPRALDLPEGLVGRSVGSSLQSAPVMIFNGKRIDRGPDKLMLQYRIGAKRAGRFTIGGQRVEVGGKVYTTQALELVVDEPPESDLFKLRLEAERTEGVFVGEPIRLTLIWYLASSPEGFSFHTGVDSDEVQILPGADPSGGNSRNDPRYVACEVDGMRMVGEVGRAKFQGQLYTTFTVSCVAIPRISGRMEVGPASVTFGVIAGTRGRGFFRENVVEKRVSRSKAIELVVQELPTEGRPGDFTGLIGVFEIESSIEPSEAFVGDPILLTVRVRGPEPMGRVALAQLEDQEAFGMGFKLSPEGWARKEQTTGSEVTFTTTIRVTDDGVDELPAIRLPYFDTAREQYEVARSRPIQLKIKPTRTVTAADAIRGSNGNGNSTSPAGVLIESGPEGVRANYTDGILVNERTAVLGLMGSPMGLGVLIAGPMAWMWVVAWGAMRERAGDESFRRRRALRRARKRLGRARSTEQIDAAIRGYLSDRFGVESEAVTALDCKRLLDEAGARHAGEQLAMKLAELQASRYGGGAMVGAEPCKVAKLLAEAEKELLA